MNRRFAAVHQRFDAMASDANSRFAVTNDRIDALAERMDRQHHRTLAFIAAMTGVILAVMML